MEAFLRNHPFLRTLILTTLLLGIALEGLLLWRYLEPVTAAPLLPDPTATPAPEVRCHTLVDVNLREGPDVSFARRAGVARDSEVIATGRNGGVPWLLVRLPDGTTGWISALDADGEALLACDDSPQILPEVDGAATANGSPEAAAPEPTITPEPTLTAAPNVRLREGNGPDLHAASRTFELSVDGSLREWGETSAVSIGTPVYGVENWSGPSDLSGQARAAWDDEFLYLAVIVEDDVIVQESREDQLFKGDAVELFLDLELAEDFDDPKYSPDDAQLIFSPGDFAGRPPSAWVYFAPTDVEALRSQIVVRAEPQTGGYSLEVRIPWQGLGVTPRPGALFGYAVALSDNDTPGTSVQESQVSTTLLAPFGDPTRWGNFILD